MLKKPGLCRGQCPLDTTAHGGILMLNPEIDKQKQLSLKLKYTIQSENRTECGVPAFLVSNIYTDLQLLFQVEWAILLNTAPPTT